MASFGVSINDITTIIKNAIIVLEYAKQKVDILSKKFIFFVLDVFISKYRQI